MATYATVNPATGETLEEFPTLDSQGVEDALARSHAAFSTWRAVSPAERSEVLSKVAAAYDERKDELAQLIALEMGKPVRQAVGEVQLSGAIYQWYADHGPGLLEDEKLDVPGADETVVRKLPVGSLIGVMPWNFPYYQVARFAAPNLMLGNTILLKHAPSCPQSALLMEEIFNAAGLVKDAYINIFATNDQIAEMIADPRVQGVSLTGSERAGAAVAEVAGRNLKKVVLELGGSDAFIVLDSQDLDATVKSATRGRMSNTGQACNAAKRFVVTEPLYDEFVEKLTASFAQMSPGDPMDAKTALGPLSSQSAADTLADQVDKAVEQGATVLTGGKKVDGRRGVLRAHAARRRHARHGRLLARSCSARSASSTRSARPTRPWSSPTPRPSGSAARCGAPTRSSPARPPTGSRSGWPSSTSTAPPCRACRSVA